VQGHACVGGSMTMDVFGFEKKHFIDVISYTGAADIQLFV
jgi:peroxiredoxin family protein